MTRITIRTVDSAPEGSRDALKAKGATWQTALDAGWTDSELTETSAVVALNLFTNCFKHLVQTDLDLPAAPGL